MNAYKMLVLTDHSGHSKENSIYALLAELRKHPSCKKIDVASRGNSQNDSFFHNHFDPTLFASPVTDQFEFREDSSCFTENLSQKSLSDYDVILMRLPHPVSNEFLYFLTENYPEKAILNRPSGIIETSSKAFLLNFPEITPPSKLLHSIEEIEAYKNQFPIVLKPLKGYGGKGIVKIENESVWEEENEITFSEFKAKLDNQPIQFLGMKFLKKVHAGDKRIVVCNKKILGASLRLPAQDSWLCNVAQGGSFHVSTPDPDEKAMAHQLSQILTDKGILLFGFDTLLGDDGKRKLSEINTLSVGGLPQIGKFAQKSVVETAADLIWDYIKKEVYGNSEITI